MGILLGKLEDKRPLGRPRLICDNIKMYLKDMRVWTAFNCFRIMPIGVLL
jgi:hypothetical protein